MSQLSLSRIEKVALRDVWPNEATDFTTVVGGPHNRAWRRPGNRVGNAGA